MVKTKRWEGSLLIHIYCVQQDKYYFIIKLSKIMQRKLSDYRGHSPIRSPIKSPMRAVSPIRLSPFSRQNAPMSPIRARQIDRSTTPNRIKVNQRVQLAKSPRNNVENYETTSLMMQRTIRNGVGLFQQLANQHKIGSEKKENRVISHNTNPFQYSENKRETLGNYPKNSFAALIQNVKQIESIQASKANYNYMNSQQLSFKTVEKSKQFDNQPIQPRSDFHIMRKNTEPVSINVLQSFGSPKVSQVSENQNQPKQSIKKFEIVPEPEQIQQVQPQKETQKQSPPPHKLNPEMVSSFEDVILLIKKASQRVREDSEIVQEQVKVSFDQKNMSFNMNPFI